MSDVLLPHMDEKKFPLNWVTDPTVKLALLAVSSANAVVLNAATTSIVLIIKTKNFFIVSASFQIG